MKVYVVKVVDGWSDEVEIIGVFKTKEGALNKMATLYDEDDDDGGAYYEAFELED